ncbi:MAG: ATP-dependent zinc metalloprotease FtsH, partial [Clostridiales bacterium]|nr:ATP-dependent zinc metalloprotease FtsH [Clostridiales bacterium]
MLELKDDAVVTYKLPSWSLFFADAGDLIRQQKRDGIIEDYEVMAADEIPWWAAMVPYLIIIVIFGLFWFFMMNRADGGGKAMSFGKARTKLATDQKKKVTFRDVEGAEEEKAELQEIVEFLKNPRKFVEIGARIPKGILLVGPPGTGKTLIAKAVAGEAGVPFFSISGSDFVELYVGVGASRVRDLFDQAKKNQPAIVFIDEIDAVGRRRGAGLGGGHDEREQTLNQLLVEMDGFGANEGVIIIAATNRPDILDPALLRPGRFDRQVYMGLPDIKGREAILRLHAENKKFEENVNFSAIAKTTAGFTGADLENLLNEAALLAARANRLRIGDSELQEAFVKVIMGPEKKSRVISEKDRNLTAYHEAGHAVVNKFLPTQDPVHQISIIPRGRAGGYNLNLPSEDKSYASRSEMFEDIIALLGGRVAEKLVLDDISTGASNDIERSSELVRKMITRYGMSDRLGPISYGSPHDEVFLGRDFTTTRNYSEKVASEIDDEVRAVIGKAYHKCEEILKENIDKLHIVAEYLLKHETMS